MAVLDTSVLALLLDAKARPPLDPETGERVKHCQERLTGLVAKLTSRRETVFVPTPVLAEILVMAGEKAVEIHEYLTRSYAFKIVPFDEKAAVELSARHQLSKNKSRDTKQTKAKVNFDRQIIAIAQTLGHSGTLYTDDERMIQEATAANLAVVSTHQLEIPPSEMQMGLGLNQPE